MYGTLLKDELTLEQKIYTQLYAYLFLGCKLPGCKIPILFSIARVLFTLSTHKILRRLGPVTSRMGILAIGLDLAV